MAEEPASPHAGDPGMSRGFAHDFQHTPVGARVPDRIGRGVFSTATMILQTGDYFVIDFLSMMVQPQQVVARVILTGGTFSQFLNALRVNIANYEGQFGILTTRIPPVPPMSPSPPAPQSNPPNPVAPMVATTGGQEQQTLPGQPAGPPPPIADLYEQLKFPEDLLGGAFANAVMIRHTPEEFCFDFISSFYPRPAVTARVFMAVGRVPSLVEAMHNSLRRYQHGGGQPPPS